MWYNRCKTCFLALFPAAEIAAELDRDEQEESGVMAAVKHQEREYLGMLEYNKTDETALIKNLVFGKKWFNVIGCVWGRGWGYSDHSCLGHQQWSIKQRHFSFIMVEISK